MFWSWIIFLTTGFLQQIAAYPTWNSREETEPRQPWGYPNRTWFNSQHNPQLMERDNQASLNLLQTVGISNNQRKRLAQGMKGFALRLRKKKSKAK